ncbi:cation:proton antiporter [Pelodictyon phaeoclathratiforme]|jgi:Kef-type K+ transport system membrane component KefB|uniref:Sodium/hydrogen exchanger n=1 Tax=Pelodictyon phaeoclathratiforme (strain DSM 5477 / BU-1) TaxID=324925 RepID=B4SG71_PELPB|nr:cation:proton antiporter [Pelodictyon phaeoclathratiforme]ACF43382.1 sodium/hydrogen exchanger [Pelodictyon phaeoclathratiforme BU-1]MBV5289324.1 cation:proton antiporter [Pelodictyon phaeoclathratiforme]
MVLMSLIDISLPLKNPVLQFSLLLLIILFAPFLLSRLKIPSLITLILAGALIGPHGLNLMLRDSSIILFGTVGLLYIMFLAGLEIDVADFRKNSSKSILFGLYTFLISIVLGIVVALYILHFSLLSSILIGSIFASHTLIVYPVVSKLGIAKNKAVNVAIGGTLITDTLALLVLAVVVGLSEGELTAAFWIRLLIGITLFSLVVILLFPVIARWFFKRFDDSVQQYLFVLAMVFFSAFLAEAAGVEAIIGAFLGGLALNRLIPRTSPLMNRIKFVGNAIFIPFFLIGVGMLINIQAFFKGYETIEVAVVITIAATVAKYLSAWITQKLFGFSLDQRRLIFGLISAHAALALATVLIGYNIIIGYSITGAPVRLLDESVLNGTILFILLTCTLATIVGEKGAQNIALAEAADDVPEPGVLAADERILIYMNDISTVDELVNLSVTVTSVKNRKGIYAMHVADNSMPDETQEKRAGKILEKAAVAASSTDNKLTGLLRYDSDILNGIAGVIREQKINELIIGLHHKQSLMDSFFGSSPESILRRCNVTTFIYRSVQPLATIKRTIIVIPVGAENEVGFVLWMQSVINIIKNTGSRMVIYASRQTIAYLKEAYRESIVHAEYKMFKEWADFLVLSNEIKKDDNLIIVMSRKNNISYHARMAKIPLYLNRYFQKNSFILIYPVQSGIPEDTCDDIPVRTRQKSVINFEKILNKIYKKIRR